MHLLACVRFSPAGSIMDTIIRQGKYTTSIVIYWLIVEVLSERERLLSSNIAFITAGSGRNSVFRKRNGSQLIFIIMCHPPMNLSRQCVRRLIQKNKSSYNLL